MIGKALGDLFFVITIFAAMLSALAMQPERAECPRGFYVNGVRPSGRYECRPSPYRFPAEVNLPNMWDWTPDPPGAFTAQIKCKHGTPRVVDSRRVACL